MFDFLGIIRKILLDRYDFPGGWTSDVKPEYCAEYCIVSIEVILTTFLCSISQVAWRF